MLTMKADGRAVTNNKQAAGIAGEKFMSLLRRYRLARGLTQGQLADKVGVTPSAVSFWESGTTLPSPEMYPKLARILGVDAMELTKAVDPEPNFSSGRSPG